MSFSFHSVDASAIDQPSPEYVDVFEFLFHSDWQILSGRTCEDGRPHFCRCENALSPSLMVFSNYFPSIFISRESIRHLLLLPPPPPAWVEKQAGDFRSFPILNFLICRLECVSLYREASKIWFFCPSWPRGISSFPNVISCCFGFAPARFDFAQCNILFLWPHVLLAAGPGIFKKLKKVAEARPKG